MFGIVAISFSPRLARRASERPSVDEASATLIDSAVAGDPGSMQALIEQVGPSMFWAVRSVLGPTHADAEDVVQQSLIAFVQSLPRFRRECQPRTYAVRIAVRAALASRTRTEHMHARDDAASRSAPSASHSPVEHVFAARRRDLVRRLLDELPTEQAEALALHVVLDVPLKEIAEATGTPLNTIKSRLRLAKQALRDKIARDGILAEELGVSP